MNKRITEPTESAEDSIIENQENITTQIDMTL